MNNQNFVNISFDLLRDKLAYLCELNDIEFIGRFKKSFCGKELFMKLKVLKSLKIFFSVILVMFFLACIAGVICFKFLGLNYYIILSGSMKPDINVDDVVVSKSLSELEVRESIDVGDIATYYYDHPGEEPQYITHRVYEKAETDEGEMVYLFKGDNNNTVDRYSVKASQIRGKYVMTIGGFGTAFEFLTSFYGIIAIVFALLTIFGIDSTIGYLINVETEKNEASTIIGESDSENAVHDIDSSVKSDEETISVSNENAK